MNVAASGTLSQLEIEQKIWEQLRLKIPKEIVADTVLKLWSQDLLQPKAKNVVARFCLINGFRESLANTLSADLKSQKIIPWDICWELVGNIDLPKETLTHFLTGAARQNALETLALQATIDSVSDERFIKVVDAHFEGLSKLYADQEQKLAYEFETVSKGALSEESKEILLELKRRFPANPKITEWMEEILNLENQELITQIKRQVGKNIKINRRFDDTLKWEGLEEKIRAISSSLDSEEVYELSVGLHMTGLHEVALNLLEKTKTSWSKREKLLELELLFSNRQFVEALDLAQKLREEFVADPDALINALYFEAKSLLSLNEADQAQIIFEDININWPNFRDVPIILNNWKTRT